MLLYGLVPKTTMSELMYEVHIRVRDRKKAIEWGEGESRVILGNCPAGHKGMDA